MCITGAAGWRYSDFYQLQWKLKWGDYSHFLFYKSTQLEKSLSKCEEKLFLVALFWGRWLQIFLFSVTQDSLVHRLRRASPNLCQCLKRNLKI